MTEFNNKFVPTAPKTYEVRYVENKEPSKLFKLASYLGVKTVYNCTDPANVKYITITTTSSSTSVTATPSTQAEIVSAAIKTTNEVGGSSIIKTDASGGVNITYNSGK